MATSEDYGHVKHVEVIVRVTTYDNKVLEGVATEYPTAYDVEDSRCFAALDKAADQPSMPLSQRILLLLLGRMDDQRAFARAYQAISAQLRRHESGVLGVDQ